MSNYIESAMDLVSDGNQLKYVQRRRSWDAMSVSEVLDKYDLWEPAFPREYILELVDNTAPAIDIVYQVARDIVKHSGPYSLLDIPNVMNLLEEAIKTVYVICD